ncbi:MAG TPA: hypothetical protein VJC16_01860 [Candidatus Nanoarchaeia archaeon]|nr:hypothetical protein [Candidatus Nanoarchaeia archaeon]
MPTIRQKLAQLKDLDEFVVLATVSAQKYQETNIEIIRSLTEEMNIPGVYVTLNKPYEAVKKLLLQKKVDARLIIFIDAVSRMGGGGERKTKECLFIGSPENLSDISIAMDQAVRALPSKEKFLFFDSLNTLLTYNEIPVVVKFIHFLSTKMRAWKVKGIIISLEKKKNQELIGELSQFCDLAIDL